MNASAAIADSQLRLIIDGKKPLRRDVIERGGTSKLGLAGRLAPHTLNILLGDWIRRLRRCLSRSDGDRHPRGRGEGCQSHGLRVPVSLCDFAISRRTVMNKAG
jgi:hypothetical protein